MGHFLPALTGFIVAGVLAGGVSYAAARLHRPRPARQILTSLDFWIGRVVPNIVFFLLGIIFHSHHLR